MFKLALVGRRNRAHYEAATLQLGEVEIVACVDPAGAERLLAESAAIDAVVLDDDASSSTVAIAAQAAASRKHLLMESPVAPSAAEVDQIAAACADSGVQFAVGRLRRFRPSIAAAKDGVSSGRLGAPGLLRIHSWVSREGPDIGAAARIGRELDLARWFFGVAPATLYATTGSRAAGEYLQVHCGFEGGGMASIDCAATLPASAAGHAPGYYSLSVIGATGAAYADDHHNTHLVFSDGEPRALISDQHSAAALYQLRAFVALVERGDRGDLGDAAGERELIAIADAVKQSFSHRQLARRGKGGYELV